MTSSGFARLRDEMRSAGEEPFANPRNAAAGSLKLLDSRLVARRPLEFVAFGLGEVSEENNIPSTQKGILDWLKSLGHRTHQWTKICRSADEILAAIDELDPIRDGFGFETDGAVIKLNDVALRERVGDNARAPKWARAWKYAARAGGNAAARYHSSSWPHGRAYARRGAGAGFSSREHDHPRDAAQRG